MRQRSLLRYGTGLSVALVATLAAGAAHAVTPSDTVAAGTYPFAARLTVGTYERGCSGALVAPQWVVTATACFTGASGPATVRLSGGRTVPVAATVAHPNAGVTLAKLPLRLTDVAPVAVASSAPSAGESLTAAGYGRTASEWVPDALHAGTATVASVGSSTLALTGSVTCKGDAGGPVLRTGSGGAPVLAGVSISSTQRGCLGETSTADGSTAARLDTLASWITTTTAPLRTTFGASFVSTNGIGGYDLADTRDLTVPFDYAHTGRQDHVLTYRPGSGIVMIARRNANNTFTTVFSSFNGIGGYDLAVAADRLVPFDWDGSGKQDHLLAYRPGHSIAFVIKHTSSGFTAVHTSRTGLGGYDLAAAQDQVVAFDYNHSGKRDHLLAYRPGNKIAWVLKRSGSGFATVSASSTGLASFDLGTTADRIVPFDYDRTGKVDALLVYRPGSRIAFVVRHTSGTTFSTAWSSFSGLPGFDLSSTRDQVTAFDYDYTGKLDHLVFYRPGGKLVSILRQGSGGGLSAIYTGTNGIGGYDVAVATDKIVAFDADRSGGQNSLLLTRPGSKIAYLVSRQPA